MESNNFAFIGGGNMARSLVSGLISSGLDPQFVTVADPSQAQLDLIAESCNVKTATDNKTAIKNADIVVLAIKPQVMREVLADIRDTVVKHRPLIISIAAGITETSLRLALDAETAIVRTMPNTPALVQSGATAMFANQNVSDAQKEKAESVMRSVGIAIWLEDESMLDAVTAVSGSGPAYFFLLMELLERSGRELGLPADAAQKLSLQTAYGAAHMALESTESTAELRQQVTSPGGTTAAALAELEKSGFGEAFVNAVKTACRRATELSKEMEQKN